MIALGQHLPSRADLLRDVAANAGQVPGCNTPEQVAAFVEGAHKKGAALAAAASAKASDMETAESVAAFILNAGRNAGRQR